MTVPLLPEISESDAAGSVAEVYEDIRAVTQLPLVNLVYRYLATEPGRLEAAWRELRPNLVDPGTIEAAEAIAAAARSDAGALPGISVAPVLDAEQLDLALATLAAYGRGNSRNLIVVMALLSGVPGTAATEVGGEIESVSAPVGAILPMKSLDELDEQSRSLLDQMAAALTAPGETVLIPGLLRHFADDSDLLAFFWAILKPRTVDGTIAARADRIDALARRALTDLPARVTAIEDPEVRGVLERFAATIPRMSVVAGILEASLTRSA